MSTKNAFLGAPALILLVAVSHARGDNLQDVPVSVQVLSGEEIERAGIQSLKDLSGFVPGINFDTGRTSTPTINVRGFPSTGNTILVDGIVVGDEKFGLVD